MTPMSVKNSNRLGLRLPESATEKLEKIASENGITSATAARIILTKAINQGITV